MGKPLKDNLVPFYHSIGTFANDVNTVQRFTSLAYSKRLTKIASATSSTTWGSSVQASSESKLEIPFTTAEDITVTLDFTFNRISTKTNAEMTEDLYTFPSQMIDVPPHHTYEMVAVIEQQHMQSNVMLEFPINFSGVLIANTPDGMGRGRI